MLLLLVAGLLAVNCGHPQAITACPPDESLAVVERHPFNIAGQSGEARFYKTQNGSLFVCFSVNGKYYQLPGITIVSVKPDANGGLDVVTQTQNGSKYQDHFDPQGNHQGSQPVP